MRLVPVTRGRVGQQLPYVRQHLEPVTAPHPRYALRSRARPAASGIKARRAPTSRSLILVGEFARYRRKVSSRCTPAALQLYKICTARSVSGLTTLQAVVHRSTGDSECASGGGHVASLF